MWLRATVVLLVILNAGVAVWWAVRGEPVDPAAPPDPGPATLHLVGEPAADRAVGPAPVERRAVAPAAAPAPAEPAPGTAPQCITLGPFADAATRDAAIAQLSPLAAQIAARETGDAPRGWRVWMAPLPDRRAVEAMVARLLAAGFNDYHVVADGAEVNGVALGRFGSEAAARAHAQALRNAGFDVAAEPLGGAPTQYWVELMLAEGDTGEALRARVGAARVEARGCNAWRDAG